MCLLKELWSNRHPIPSISIFRVRFLQNSTFGGLKLPLLVPKDPILVILNFPHILNQLLLSLLEVHLLFDIMSFYPFLFPSIILFLVFHLLLLVDSPVMSLFQFLNLLYLPYFCVFNELASELYRGILLAVKQPLFLYLGRYKVLVVVHELRLLNLVRSRDLLDVALLLKLKRIKLYEISFFFDHSFFEVWRTVI